MNNIRLVIKDITSQNIREKYESAVVSLAKAMNLPVTVKPKDRETGESFVYQSQGDLVRKWSLYVSGMMDAVYNFLVSSLDLPKIETFLKKEVDGKEDRKDDVIKYHGKIVFNPENGKPVKQTEFNEIIKIIEKYLNKHLDPASKKIILDSVALGRVLAKRLVNTPELEMKKLPLDKIKLSNKTFDFISNNMNVIEQSYGKLNPEETERMENYLKGINSFVDIGNQKIGNYITHMKSDTIYEVKDTILNGVMQRKSKQEISQDLFEKFGNLNRDWDMIAETEIMTTSNEAFLKESVAESAEGEPSYFKRIEMSDSHVCPFCRSIKGVVVKWSDVPLESEDIDDKYTNKAIWEGKSNVGRSRNDWWIPSGLSHPFCRGSWMRWYPYKKEEEK
jgi:hypothetical protein